MTKLLALVILFSTTVRAVVVAKLLILGISPLTSFTLALRVVLVANLVMLDVWSSMLLISALYSVFLTTSLFTTLLSLPKSTGTDANFPISYLSPLLFKLLKLSRIVFNLSTSILSNSAFKLAKTEFAALLHCLVYLNQQKQMLISQYLIYLLYFLNCSSHQE